MFLTAVRTPDQAPERGLIFLVALPRAEVGEDRDCELPAVGQLVRDAAVELTVLAPGERGGKSV